MNIVRLSKVFGSKVGGKRFFSGGGGGGGGKKPPFNVPKGHYIDAPDPDLLEKWLRLLNKLAKDSKAYSVPFQLGIGRNDPKEQRYVFIHCLNKGGEESIMNKGLEARSGMFSGAMVRAHTVSEKEPAQDLPKTNMSTEKMLELYTLGEKGISEVGNHTVPSAQYFFITNQKPISNHDGAMTGIQWDVATLAVVAWLLRIADGTFFIGGELTKHLDKDGKSPK